MKLLLEINEAAETLIKTTASLQELMDITGLGIEPINEAVTTFLSSKASQIEGGKFVQPKGMSDEEWQQSRENVINIYTAVHALTDMNTAMSLQPAGGNASGGTEIDQNAVPIGSVLDKFYGSDGDQAHKVAKARLIEIGRTVSPSLRQQAEAAVNDPTKIRAYSNKLQTAIEPVMNKLLSQERQQATSRMEKSKGEERQANMARPMQGAVPQRSGA